MAVKPIVNPIPPGFADLDRSKEISRKASNGARISNEGKSVVPGSDYSKNYEVVIKDLDTAVMNHVKNVMKPKVKDNGELVQVPIMYANQERWALARKNGHLKDNNGTIMLPLMIYKRSNIEFNEELPSWKHDLTGEYISVMRSSQWSKENQYSRFSVLTGNKPVRENITTGPPQYVNTTYEFQIFTNYMEQMNGIVEGFMQQSGTYWGDNTSYRFLCNVDGGIADATEMPTGGERIIKSNFSVSLKGYLLPEYIVNIINRKRANTNKQITPARINFSENIE